MRFVFGARSTYQRSISSSVCLKTILLKSTLRSYAVYSTRSSFY